MEEFKLNAKSRSEIGKGAARRLRAQGLIPAVLYGQKAQAVGLTLNPKELFSCLCSGAGLNNLIQLKIDADGSSEEATVLVKDLQIDPIRRVYMHADLIRVDASAQVKVAIPIVLVGKAIGIQMGGIVSQAKRELEVWCRADSIPSEIQADITHLELGHSLHLSEIELPAGVRSALQVDVTLAACVAPVEEEEVKPAVAEGAVEAVEGEAGAAPAEGGEKPAEGGEPAKEAKDGKDRKHTK